MQKFKESLKEVIRSHKKLISSQSLTSGTAAYTPASVNCLILMMETLLSKYERLEDIARHEKLEHGVVLAKSATVINTVGMWRPISSRPLGELYPVSFLIFTTGGDVLTAFSTEAELVYLTKTAELVTEDCIHGEATHWMPFPPPPR